MVVFHCSLVRPALAFPPSKIFSSSFQFYIPTKSEWVFHPFEEVAWVSHDEIVITITERLNNKSAPMVWMKKNNTTFEKLFVVWW